MKKVAIITLNGNFNYGNRLQNYALQRILMNMGIAVETLVLHTEDNHKNDKLNTILRKDVIALIKKKVYATFYEKKVADLKRARLEKFKLFTSKYIVERNDVNLSDIESSREINNSYDYFVTGSDQVWNPNYTFGNIDNYFLTFADNNKRIAYSPSFGVSEIPEELIVDYKKWINGIDYLSIREDAGVDIIKKLTNREAELLVDPTLLLTKEEWLSVSREAESKPKQKYLLTYFLGNISKSNKNQIDKLSKKYNLKIINLNNIRESDAYISDPSEFIDFINDCTIFCTDSFHGVVFSILLEKPFIVYERSGKTSMYSRINTLLSKFNLDSRKLENIKTSKNPLEINYEAVSSILDIERRKSLLFLKNALKVEDTE